MIVVSKPFASVPISREIQAGDGAQYRSIESRSCCGEMVTLGEDGSSSMTFTMPRLNGALRFRTVVIHDDLYGATEQSVPVVAPVGIDATWPRAVALRR